MDCKNCGKWLTNSYERLRRVDSVFCNPACKDEYHAQQRKIARKKKRAETLITELLELTQVDKEFTAAAAIVSIKAVLDNTRWGCRNCGQGLFHTPTLNEVCDFCQHTSWQIKQIYAQTQVPGTKTENAESDT